MTVFLLRSDPLRLHGRAPLLAALVALGATTLSGCGHRANADETPASQTPEVLTAVAAAGEVDATLRLPARTEAGQVARLYARSTGFVSERTVELGDTVKADAVLARIATPEVDQAVRVADAELLEARTDTELAKSNLDRAEPLAEAGALSQELLSDRRAGHAAAKAAEASAVARLASARDRQAFQTIRAPFDGVISQRNVERGDRVVGDQAAAATPLFELVALDHLRVIVDVPQSAVMQMKPGLHAQVTFPELPGETFDAEVVHIARRIDAAAGGMRTELRLPNPDLRLPAGMVGQVVLQLPRANASAVVPISAVIQRADGAHVATVTAEGTLVFRDVTLGRNLGATIEITQGVAAGEAVVLSPNAMLVEGAAVVAKAQVVQAP